MYYCILNNSRTEVVQCDDTDHLPTGAEYVFELSSASSVAEASAIASEIGRLYSKTKTREQNVARIERFLGGLDVLDQQFAIVWNNDWRNIRDWLSGVNRSSYRDDDSFLADVAGCGGVLLWYARFFVSHAAEMLVGTAIGDEEELTRFFPDEDHSIFAQETRRYFERLEDARS